MLQLDANRKSILMLLAATVTLASCGKPVDASKTLVTDGKLMADTDLPAIVQISADLGGNISSSCTATWVSHNTIITAAHCLWENGRKLSNVKVSRGVGVGTQAIKVLTHPKYVDANVVPIDCYDVGVLIFPDNSSPEFIPVAPAAPAAGDPIMIVGFGKFDHADGNSSGKKRFGNNKITKIDGQGRLTFEGTARPTTGGDAGTGENGVNSQGDSGGPMLFKGMIIGTSSSVDANLTSAGNLRGHYENLRHDPITAWLLQTTSSGAIIRGLKGDDAISPQPEKVSTDLVVHVKDQAPADKIELDLASVAGAKVLKFSRFETIESLNTADATAPSTEATFSELRSDRAFFTTSLAAAPAAASFYLKVQAFDAAGKVIAESRLLFSPL